MIHGGDLYRNRVALDFSTNVNPFGMPERVKAALHRAVGLCGTYPDPKAENLKRAVSAYAGVPEEYLLFGNGASELFMAVIHGIRPKKVLIPVPSFYGYEYAAKSTESEIIYYEMKPEHNFCMAEELTEILTEETGLLFLANPNNPTGNLLEKEKLKVLLRHCADKGIFVVLDESFIEFSGSHFSMASEIGAYDHLILIRSFTKIFAIPGVRLGYLICSNKTVRDKAAMQLPEWNLSHFAQEAGCICAKETEFVTKTRTDMERERQFLAERLGKMGYAVYDSMANFILFYGKEPLYESLLKKGILIRDCSNFRGLGSGFYRIAVKRRKENEILLESL